MGLKDCLWCIGGASKGVSGARFSLYPMSDNFVEIILGGLEKQIQVKFGNKQIN